jgi:hypothetical protein
MGGGGGDFMLTQAHYDAGVCTVKNTKSPALFTIPLTHGDLGKVSFFLWTQFGIIVTSFVRLFLINISYSAHYECMCR